MRHRGLHLAYTGENDEGQRLKFNLHYLISSKDKPSIIPGGNHGWSLEQPCGADEQLQKRVGSNHHRDPHQIPYELILGEKKKKKINRNYYDSSSGSLTQILYRTVMLRSDLRDMVNCSVVWLIVLPVMYREGFYLLCMDSKNTFVVRLNR